MRNSLKFYCRVTKSGPPRSHQDAAPNKPPGLAGPSKPTVTYPPTTATTANDNSESNISTDNEEVTDNLVFPAVGSNNSVV